MIGVGQLAGESREQYTARLESEVEWARDKIEQLERHAETDATADALRIDALETKHADTEDERDFLREQLTELAAQIRSASAPRSRQQMARLLAGVLRGEDWRHGSWR